MNTQNINQNYQNNTNSHVTKNPFIIFAIIFLVGIGTFLYWSNKQATAPTHQNSIDHTIPEKGAFYLAELHNNPVLFYTFKGLHLQNGTLADDYSGRFIAYEKLYNVKQNARDIVDFRDLQNPKKLFTFENQAIIDNLIINSDKTFLLLSVLGGELDITNTIYQINLKTMESKKIWENEIGKGQTPYNNGIAYLMEFIPDRYVVFAFIKGEPPPTQSTAGVVIRNILSGKEKVLGVVGDIQIDLSASTVSYKQLTRVQEPCSRPKDPVCFATDKYKMVYKPGGESLNQDLP